MRKELFLSLGVLTLLAGCTTRSETTSVDTAYVNRLNARLAGYNQQAGQFDLKFKQDGDTLRQGASLSSMASEQVSLASVPGDIKQDAEFRARAVTLRRFIKEAAVSGRFGLMTSWLQNNAADVLKLSQGTESKIEQFKNANGSSQADSTQQLYTQFLELVYERGFEEGIAEELLALANDVHGYQTDYTGAAHNDEERRKEAEASLMAYLSAPRITVEAPPVGMAPIVPAFPKIGPTTTNCMPNFMGGMNCTTQ